MSTDVEEVVKCHIIKRHVVGMTIRLVLVESHQTPVMVGVVHPQPLLECISGVLLQVLRPEQSGINNLQTILVRLIKRGLIRIVPLWLSDNALHRGMWYGQSSPCQSHSTLQLPTCYERLLALSNPCWTLPVGCSLVHRGQIESTINLYPAKGKAMAMSAATTSLEWPD